MSKNVLRLASIVICSLLLTTNGKAQSIYEQLQESIDVVVDINGTGDFASVQKAISSIPDNNDTWKVIFVKKGVYHEKVVLNHKKTKVVLVGEDVDSTIITHDDYGDAVLPGHTFSTYTFRADANDFQAYNISFKNPTTQGQGVAYHSNGDRQILYHCRLLGNQDTYFDNFRTRRYIKDCFIEGTVDYIFGFGVTLFDSCQVHTKRTGGYITASSTPQHYEFGHVLKDCRLTVSPDVNGIYLGRPWFPYANTMFYECWEPEELNSSGWHSWDGREETCIYFEYNCSGPGADTTNRASYGHQLDPSKASRYTKDQILSASNFPSDMGEEVDTTELMSLYRRFEASGYADRADTILMAGRGEYPDYPTDDWTPQYHTEVYDVIRDNTIPFLDSANSELNISGIYCNDEAISDFKMDSLTYAVELDDTVTVIPTLNITGEGIGTEIEYPEELPGMATITALSRDKTNGKTYEVYFSKEAAYWDTELDLIIVDRTDTIIPEKGIYDYEVTIEEDAASYVSLVVYRKYQEQSFKRIMPTNYPGTIKVDVTAIDGISTATYAIDVKVATDIFSIETNPQQITVISPSRETLKLQHSGEPQTRVNIEIYNLNGRIIDSFVLSNIQEGINETGINVSSLSRGIYLYRIRLDKKTISGKFLKD